MTRVATTCPTCSHTSQAPAGCLVSCPCCYKPMVAPYASATASAYAAMRDAETPEQRRAHYTW